MDPLTISRLTGVTIQDMSLFDIGLRLASALALGILIALVYRRVHKAFAYSYSMVVGIVMISMIVATVLMVIDNSLARAFGLVGALAIIRFRMPVKDIKDIIFIFLSVANGIASGAGHFRIALLGVLGSLVVCFLMYMTKFGGPRASGQLLLKVLAGKELLESDSGVFETILREHCLSFSLVEMHMGKQRDCEIVYSIRLIEEEKLQDLLKQISDRETVEQVVVLSAIHNMDVQ
ncbi:MAG: DUF4956 domain-containing protein [Candidatus Sumerlaeota bacterium]